MYKKRTIEEVTVDELRQGKVCPRNHIQQDGKNLRFRADGHCLGCRFRLPNGPMDIQIDGVQLVPPPNTKYFTAEEKSAARSRGPNELECTKPRKGKSIC